MPWTVEIIHCVEISIVSASQVSSHQLRLQLTAGVAAVRTMFSYMYLNYTL